MNITYLFLHETHMLVLIPMKKKETKKVSALLRALVAFLEYLCSHGRGPPGKENTHFLG